ncbi:imidazole glycerol phosphate synthase subunit HisH [Priestia taiwanensis]|uniref:Imidazole glycerol phosphate synthase subunit HisH n=1 Tax=Priestia taiwanensis TaxID=1347902 RepID=A0A917EKA1_9BACI|nr:imidazole glycerol phosphate synthase subunit HisH [Priestia taiwanensis]MBM7361701.1 glutamine amidotransferase [Priestia taiwanensis]GGE56320.1 imidazole glycerol phosphate synthase subunit HisH [Priestia taiwanensis]
MIAVIDYGMGNICSVIQALEKVGLSSVLTSDRDEIKKSKGIILPGVGAFPKAMHQLKEKELDVCIREEVADGKPLLGICLGMQLLFTNSEEIEWTEGLEIIPGTVHHLPYTNKVPHMGWNMLEQRKETPLLTGVRANPYVYYVHSYYVECDDCYIDASSEYSVRVPGIISYKNIYGTQFHPEKSGDIGLQIVQNFKKVVEACSFSQQST